MQKGFIIGIALVVIVVLVILWAHAQYSAGEGSRANVSDATGSIVEKVDGKDVFVNKENSHFEFQGYTPVKTEIGTFDDWTGTLTYNDNGNLVQAEGRINAASVNTETGGMLNKHLMSDDFFDVEKYPTITFISKKIKDGTMTGDLTFRGVTKEISFPVNVTDDGFSTEFYLDTTPFNFKYAAVNKEVRLAFSFKK